MSEEPIVSVITPFFNARRTILETLASIRAQTFTSFEMIAVNDGSTDDTVEIVARSFPEARIVEKENGGQPTARNAGIRAARGNFIAFLDADDLWESSKLQRQVDYMTRHPDYSWSYTDAWFFEEYPSSPRYRASDRHPLLAGDILRPLFLNNFIPSPTTIFRRELFEQIGLWDEEVQTAEDWNMWLRIASDHPIGLCHEPLARYRIHADSKIAKTDPFAYCDSIYYIIESHAAQSPETLSSLVSRSKSNQETKLALRLLKQNRKTAARRLLLRAIKRRPLNFGRFAVYLYSFLPQVTMEWGISSYRRIGHWRLALLGHLNSPRNVSVADCKTDGDRQPKREI